MFSANRGLLLLKVANISTAKVVIEKASSSHASKKG
jgi:hypothetical protein